MPARSGAMLRPLLEVPRAELVAYLRRRSLPWTDDPSNADERPARNFLRRRVLPLLRERWPGLGAAIARSAALAAEARALLGARAEEQAREAQVASALAVSGLRRLQAPDRHNVLRYWLEKQRLPMPDQRRLLEIAGPMLRARADAQPTVHWPGALVRRHGDLLHAAPVAPPESVPTARSARARTKLRWDWLRRPRLALPDGSSLELRPDARGVLARPALPPRVTVAFRSADGTVGGRAGGRRLKRLLREAAREPWRRGAVPLVYSGRRLLAVGDHWHAQHLAKGAGGTRTSRCRLRWFRN
jgi:tRNA(Ile)-lysidine synthase